MLPAKDKVDKVREIKEITISHGLPDSNLGGAALGISLAQVLKMNLPESRINYISSHIDPELIQKAHPYMKQACPTVHILSSLVVGRIEHQDIKRNFLRKMFGIVWAAKLLFSIIYLLFPGLLRSETAYRIRQSDMVISRGTNIFYDKKGTFLRSLLAMCWLLYPLAYSWRVGTPFAIYAQSFGPVQNAISRWLMKFVFSKAVVIMPREKISHQFLLKELKLPNEIIELVPDSVFSMSPVSEEEVQKCLSRLELPFNDYLAVTIRSGMHGEEDHINKIAAVIDHCLDSNSVSKCVIVVQCPRFKDYLMFECDEDISMRLAEALQNKERIEIIHAPKGPSELLKIYGGAKVTFGMRLHSVILSMVAGTPAVALSYWGPKTVGIMTMAGLSDHCFDVDTFSSKEVVEKISQIIENIDHEQMVVESRIKSLSQESRNAVRSIILKIS